MNTLEVLREIATARDIRTKAITAPRALNEAFDYASPVPFRAGSGSSSATSSSC